MAVAWRGGYGQDARAVVAMLAGLSVVGALWWSPAEAGAATRLWAVRVLGAIAVLAMLSAGWTIGQGSVALRDGLAVLGLAALVVVAATLRPLWMHAAVVLAAALVVASIGLVTAIARAEPLALEICGTWRPAGPFEYPPTLGLLCAGALPVAVAVACSERLAARLAGGGAAWFLALSVALTANRTAIGLAACALIATVALTRERSAHAGVVALATIAAAAASALIVGSDLGGASAGRLVLAALFVALPCAAAAASGSGPRRDSSPWGASRGTWIAVVAVAGIAATAGSVVADRGTHCQGDASHGRIGIWKAGVATAADRPIQGFGSGTFLAASRKHQLEQRPRPTRFAHNMPLELWVELGLLGVALAIAWYASVADLVIRAHRADPAAWLLIPMVVAFPLANLLDWPWHLLGVGAIWAVAAGGLGGAVVLARVLEERS